MESLGVAAEAGVREVQVVSSTPKLLGVDHFDAARALMQSGRHSATAVYSAYGGSDTGMLEALFVEP